MGKIETSAVKMTESEAREKGEAKSNFLGRLLVRSELSKLEIVYFPFLLVEFRQEHKQGFFRIGRQQKFKEPNSAKSITVICDGTTNIAAVADMLPDLAEIEVDEEQLKELLFTEQDMESAAYKLAFRMTRRFMGNYNIVMCNTRAIYRPYYIAWYGDITDGKKARYLPFAADGFDTNRVI